VSGALHYTPEPVAAEFHADSISRVRGLLGPYGSGKSTSCVVDLFLLAQGQEPQREVDRHGNERWVRDVRSCVIRNTYPELKSTTIKTWQEWIPQNLMHIKFDAPITGNMEIELMDSTILKWEVYFLALDRPDHAGKLKSLELTNAYVNEASEIPWSIIEHLDARIDRYPPKMRGGATRACMIMDTNPPDTDSRWYETFEVLKPKGWRCYHQPAALIERGDYLVPNPAATYARFQNSGFGYWANMAQGKTKEWIRVYVQGKYGTVFTGKPVWEEYCDDLHYTPEPLEVYPGLPLILGTDFGLTPACAFMQLKPNGQLRIVDQLVSKSMGIRQFARDALRPYLMANYPGQPVMIYGDPAGSQRSQVSDEETCLKELAKQGFAVEPACTNSFIARREAVAGFMTTMVEGGYPAFVIGPKAPMVRKACMGGYQYARVAVSGQEERYHDEPVKNMFSHIADGLQYGALMATTPKKPVGMVTQVTARPVRKVRRSSV
jgi:hypothetical protein